MAVQKKVTSRTHVAHSSTTTTTSSVQLGSINRLATRSQAQTNATQTTYVKKIQTFNTVDKVNSDITEKSVISTYVEGLLLCPVVQNL